MNHLYNKHLGIAWMAILILGLCTTACSMSSNSPGSLSYSQDYRSQEIRGWTLHVSNDLVNSDPKLAKLAIYHIDQQLSEIENRLPEHSLPTLRKVPIWLEREQGDRKTMFYHSDRKSLVRQGISQDKYRSIEISNAATYVSWSRRHPWMLLHEMCHAWHHQVIGFEDPSIYRTWRAALDQGKYFRVVGGAGFYGRAYATTNEYEYFAEISEAFFSRNDYYPYTRDDLRLYDPEGFQLVRRLWRVR